MSSYDLKSLNLPRITGRALHAAAAALENPLVGPLALRKLMADAGFAAWRKRGVDHAPAFTSRSPAPGGEPASPEPPAFPGRTGGFARYRTSRDPLKRPSNVRSIVVFPEPVGPTSKENLSPLFSELKSEASSFS